MKPKYISASGITAEEKCSRKAYLEGLGLTRFNDAALVRGSQLHEAVENYLKGRTTVVDDVLGDHARTNGFLPEPGSDILVELGIGCANNDAERYAQADHWSNIEQTIDGVPVRGLIDLIRFDRGRIEVWDHKTTAGWWFAETEESLRSNIQIWMYAAHVVAYVKAYFTPERAAAYLKQPILLGHIQYRKTDRPTPDDVRNTACFETHEIEVVQRWEMIQDMARDMLKRRDGRLLDTHVNRGHCSAYGGCPFRSFCDMLPPGPTPAFNDPLNKWRRKQ